MSQVTLIGTRLADVGQEFVYKGETDACEGCPFRNQCLNLSAGTRYRVSDVREGGQTLDCAVHDEGVIAVEVDPTPMVANVASKGAYTGSKSRLEGPCPHTECPSHELCVPDGMEFDREHRIREVLGDPPHDHCALGRNLTTVEFAPAEE